MSLTDEEFDSVKSELARLHENCLYSAQSYFEAAKKTEFWGKMMVFLPACISAISGFMSAASENKMWGAISAVAGSVAATAAFLGSERNAPDFLNSARAYTALRHKVHLEMSFLSSAMARIDVEEKIRSLNAEYRDIVALDMPVPNRSFALARRRIGRGLVS